MLHCAAPLYYKTPPSPHPPIPLSIGTVLWIIPSYCSWLVGSGSLCPPERKLCFLLRLGRSFRGWKHARSVQSWKHANGVWWCNQLKAPHKEPAPLLKHQSRWETELLQQGFRFCWFQDHGQLCVYCTALLRTGILITASAQYRKWRMIPLTTETHTHTHSDTKSKETTQACVNNHTVSSINHSCQAWSNVRQRRPHYPLAADAVNMNAWIAWGCSVSALVLEKGQQGL